MKFNKRTYIKKFNLIGFIISSIFLGLIIYASNLQIVNYNYFNNEAKNNAVKQRKLPAPRGEIVDRNGVILASTVYQNDLYIIPHYFHDDLNIICANIILDCATLAKKIKLYPLNRFLVAQNISDKLADDFKKINGLFIYRFAKREYNLETATTHIVGYTGRINRLTLETENENAIYADDDYVGQSGLELIYDKELHGINGAEQYVVRANGLELLSPNRFLPQNKIIIPPANGSKLVLSIDERIQLALAIAMGNKKGGAVMIDIHTGQIIAMYSNPNYDPKNVRKSFGDSAYPLMNRALSSYAPGSTFKLITALAALETGVVDPHKKEHCPGSYSFGGRVWRCWKHEGHGGMNLRDAIQHSCDVYFYKLAQKVGLPNIVKYARMLGLGEHTGVDLDNESRGNLPVVKGSSPGTLLNTVIGQGVVQITPLQLANAYATMINGGKLYAPRLAFVGNKPIILKENHFKQSSIDFLMDALYAVVNEEGGTSYYSRSSTVILAGKTGTAQVAGLDKKKKDNAWFVGYYPIINPQVVVSVFVEAGEHGSSIVPIANKAIEEYSKEHASICR